MDARGLFPWAACFLAVSIALPPAFAQDEHARVEYAAEGLRDPFQTCIVKEPQKVVEALPEESVEVVKPLPAFSVQGIFWGGRFPQAIVNNKVIREGDIIEEAKVVRISRDSIKVLFANREFSLAMLPLQANTTNSSDIRKEAK